MREINQRAANFLEQMRQLLELNDENPFKVRAFERAQPSVLAAEDLMERVKEGTLTELAGVGKGISEALTEFLTTGKSKALAELQATLPDGLLELVQIPGLGPKKARKLIDQLDIHSIGELEYACRENRLIKIDGFGEKIQQKILSGIESFHFASVRMRYWDVKPILDQIEKTAKEIEYSVVGEAARGLEIITKLDFLAASPKDKKALQLKVEKIATAHELKIPLEFHVADPKHYGFEQVKLSSSSQHWDALGSPKVIAARSEQEFYEKMGLPFIPAEFRETGEEVALAKIQGGKALRAIIDRKEIQGCFHNHTTYSDGSNSIEEMVKQAERLGLRYIGISDHSQTAAYARGLKLADLKKQKKEIDQVQALYPKIKIFWGIESDILNDGSLDYEDSVLKHFDFVIGSIHSGFRMSKEDMTRRILKAMDNPHLVAIGHISGRLLLGRSGYEVDYEKILTKAAKKNIAIEINSHPARLDLDWRHGTLVRDLNVPVMINPDAHELAGIAHIDYGVLVARKGLIPAGQVLNHLSAQEMEKWLKQRNA